MSNKKPSECDNCGKRNVRIIRKYKSERYCSTCYAREFKLRKCPACGKTSRIDIKDKLAICINCERSKPCIRCGKEQYKIGKITEYGPCCNSCSKYFSEKKECVLCGKYSNCVARLKKFNYQKVCGKCSRLHHATCPKCHRYRELHISPAGIMICYKCLMQGDVPCPICKRDMPAGRGNSCEDCYWLNLANKRITIYKEHFSKLWVRNMYDSFGKWLINRVGSNKAAITLRQYIVFFYEIEKNSWKELSYSILLSHYGAEGLRRIGLPIYWLKDANVITVDPLQKHEDSERRLIEKYLYYFDREDDYFLILNGYYNYLSKKKNKVSLKTIRVSLRAAIHFLEYKKLIKNTGFSQNLVNKYISINSGKRASVFGFIRYLSRLYGIDILVPKSSPPLSRRRKKSEKEITDYIKHYIKEFTYDEVKWVSLAVAYFHRSPKYTAKTILKSSIVKKDSGLSVRIKNKVYWIPAIDYFLTADSS